MINRRQKLYVLCRNKKFWNGTSLWVSDISLASVYLEQQVKKVVRLDVGVPCDKIEIQPMRVQRKKKIAVLC